MTIEEAIEILEKEKNLTSIIEAYGNGNTEWAEAYNMAIDALKSKQAQLNAIELINEMIDYKTVAENIG